MAINLTFLDPEKTLTDKEIDAWIEKLFVEVPNIDTMSAVLDIKRNQGNLYTNIRE